MFVLITLCVITIGLLWIFKINTLCNKLDKVSNNLKSIRSKLCSESD